MAKHYEGAKNIFDIKEGQRAGETAVDLNFDDLIEAVRDAGDAGDRGVAEVIDFEEAIRSKGELTDDQSQQLDDLNEEAQSARKTLVDHINKSEVIQTPIVQVGEVELRVPFNIKEQEEGELMERVENIKKELYENAGERTAEEVEELIADVGEIFKRESEHGEGFIVGKVSDVENGPFGQEYFIDKHIAYLPRKGEAVFVGDTHGDFEATVSALEQTDFIESMESGRKDKTLVLLGDYADRGKKDLANMELVLSLKQKYPDNVVVLRGNHEEAAQVARFGFYKSLEEKFKDGNKHADLFKKYVKLFDKMPGVCITANGIIATHGGIPNKDIGGLEDINESDQIYDMRWSDPTDETDERVDSVSRGPGIKKFGKSAFSRFMDSAGSKVMIRSHQTVLEGARRTFDNKLATVFSNGGSESVSTRYVRKVHEPKIAAVSLEDDIGEWQDNDFQDVEYRIDKINQKYGSRAV